MKRGLKQFIENGAVLVRAAFKSCPDEEGTETGGNARRFPPHPIQGHAR
jgi:hypothetical protein